MLYVTYTLNNQMRRAVISQRQYEAYRKDASIQNLQIHANQNLMEQAFNEVNGIKNSTKQLIYG